jgi:hypothetical protein
MFTSDLCDNNKPYLYDTDTEIIGIYLCSNAMPANCALQLKHVAGFGTFKTCPYNCVTLCVLLCDLCWYV